ncbi:hypothetical protein GCM10023340_33730 [Nocardioides marinquilinus]|uniref:Rhodanese domain-containing protein n=1 Tax=Nocardioides marinquilinus TaxID=1210400 RepID=A0ABP9PVC5_9ACTN
MSVPTARRVTAEQVADAVLAGAWVVDLRSGRDFAAGHVPGSVSVGFTGVAPAEGLSAAAGWLVPWCDDIVLLTDAPVVLEPALRELARLGLDDVATHVVGDEPGPSRLTARYRVADWAEYREACHRGTTPVVVDVRDDDEWRAGHLPGALHLAVPDLERVAASLPRGELWVHAATGHRAGLAASLLHRAGRDVVHVDDAWERVGALRILTTPHAA